MKWSQPSTRTKAVDVYSDSDDGLCDVKDDCEEKRQLATALSLFLKSPKVNLDHQ